MSLRLPSILNFARSPSPAAALLYVAAAALATPVGAETLEAYRVGEMRGLVLASAPAPVPDVGFTGGDGQETTLAASNGRVRLVNFWATWCVPCRTEMPELEALARDPPADVEVITIATGRNTPDGIDRFRDEQGITALPNALDPKGALARAMDVPGLPVTVILDRDGIEVGRLLGGANWNSPEARALLGHLAEAG
ncbi:MAG: TlpA disulfide reductase family protein [Amaricoccus sp.]|uniref:TlpA family protein disulfide reductase n=1 Tax=Amaricoccus sp. TaxID=1872485 RepID=UPI0039E510D9